jgi:hypothetical protein
VRGRLLSPLADPPLADLIVQLAWEGGVELINFLLAKAISDDASSNSSNIRDWTYKDIMHLNKKQQLVWKNTCLEELKSLQEHKAYEICDLPKGQKPVKCKWVFDIKSDGRNKARLVAKGFSQIERIDFGEIFYTTVRTTHHCPRSSHASHHYVTSQPSQYHPDES